MCEDNSDQVTDITVDQVRKHYVQMTGSLRINGHPVSSIRSIELLHLVSSMGGTISRSDAEKTLYGGFCARSSLWYPLKVCQQANINIYYDKKTKSIVLDDLVYFDYAMALDYLEHGEYKAAVWVLHGWPVASTTNSYMKSLKDNLKDQILLSLASSFRSEIEDALDTIEAKNESYQGRCSADYSCCFC